MRISKKKEEIDITGRVETLIRHGTVPVATCQRLTASSGYNDNGQPLNRLRWGHFKVANYKVDGQVVARRLLEATLDANGDEHLLVERLYVAGFFVRMGEFDQTLREHAAELGISSDHIHFMDGGFGSSIPYPLRTGDAIYRDSNLPEVDPSAIASGSPDAAALGNMFGEFGMDMDPQFMMELQGILPLIGNPAALASSASATAFMASMVRPMSTI